MGPPESSIIVGDLISLCPGNFHFPGSEPMRTLQVEGAESEVFTDYQHFTPETCFLKWRSLNFRLN